MESSNYPLPVSWGPLRLKAAYQRNMLWAMGATAGLVLLTVALATLLFGSSAATPPLGPGSYDPPARDTVVVDLRQPPIIIPDVPIVHPEPPQPSTNEGSIIVPVDDSSLLDQGAVDPNAGSWSDPGGNGIDIGGGDFPAGSGLVIDIGEVLPSIDSFVKVERQPELVYSVEPEYPRWVRETGVEGEVVIKALVGREGDVLDAVVYVSSGNKLLDEAALAVAGKYKYQPAVQNGRPIAIWVTYKVAFKLSR